MESICFIEDDPTIQECVSSKLKSKGYDVVSFESAEEFLKSALKAELDWRIPCNLFIIDVMLGGKKNGFELCQEIRNSNPTVPVLFLSALSEPEERIQGLSVGADDYLTKPFEMEELLLRVRGMIRRHSWYGKMPENQKQFEWRENTVDFQNFTGKSGNRHFVMTQKECMVLKLLVENEGKIVTRDEILDRVWGYRNFPSARTVDNFILRLRKNFDKNSKSILSCRGLGYKFIR